MKTAIKKTLLAATGFAAIAIACQKNTTKPAPANQLTGKWAYVNTLAAATTPNGIAYYDTIAAQQGEYINFTDNKVYSHTYVDGVFLNDTASYTRNDKTLTITEADGTTETETIEALTDNNLTLYYKTTDDYGYVYETRANFKK